MLGYTFELSFAGFIVVVGGFAMAYTGGFVNAYHALAAIVPILPF